MATCCVSATLGFPKLLGSQWLGLSALKGLPARIAQQLTALIRKVLVKADVATRLEDLQALPRNPALLGDDFLRWVRSQIDAWHTVANNVIVEVIG